MKPLHKHDKLYIIIYDISCNRRRSKISKLLESYGIRVQKSTFEVITSSTRIKHLAEELEELASLEGNVRIYPITKQGSLDTITINSHPPLNSGKSWVF